MRGATIKIISNILFDGNRFYHLSSFLLFSDEERDMAKPIRIYFQNFLAKVPKMGRKTLLIKITLILSA